MKEIDNPVVERFQEVLNLSLNESRVYYAMLQKPDSSINELAEFTQLPRSRIYEMLSKLAAKSLVRRNTMDTGYQLVPPEDSIQIMIKELEEQTQRQKQSLVRIQDYLDDVWRNNITDETEIGVKLIPSHSIEPFILSDIRDLDSRMLIAAASNNPIIDWRNVTRELSKNITKNLDVRYLVFKEELATQLKNSLKNLPGDFKDKVKVRYNSELHISFLILDTISYLFIFTSDSMVEPTVLRSVSNQMTKALSWMYNTLWNNYQN